MINNEKHAQIIKMELMWEELKNENRNMDVDSMFSSHKQLNEAESAVKTLYCTQNERT